VPRLSTSRSLNLPDFLFLSGIIFKRSEGRSWIGSGKATVRESVNNVTAVNVTNDKDRYIFYAGGEVEVVGHRRVIITADMIRKVNEKLAAA
jgi:hypothetical protein